MKLLFSTIAIGLVFCVSAAGQWIRHTVETTAGFRGLSVVSERVVWASGTGGTVIRTVDGGKTWNVMTVPGAEKLDFRDIEAFDAQTAYILSIGSGDSSRIYKTIDGGRTWKLQFQNTDEKKFFDAIACWDRANCIAMSDPVEGHYPIIATSDGGASWKPIVSNKMPAAKEGEAAFAASGTCLIAAGRRTAFLVSGGADARVFRSDDRGVTWSVAETPIVKGTPGSGIFSIAMRGDLKHGVVVGGSYERPNDSTSNIALTKDGGRSWISAAGLSGYRSGVTFAGESTIIAVGTSGTDVSFDRGKSWKQFDTLDLNAVMADKRKNVWAVGPQGLVVRAYFGTITLD
ncbi:MAG: WD40/YVTN/BNR-like repeat-containing protein [Pyrinomonadaceae bacterium]